MEDVNVSNDLRQLSHGQVKALEYSCYDINGYYFRTVKLEVSCPVVATINSGVVTIDYYGILQNIVEYMFSGTKELKVVFF
jgi:DNA polymerase II large subunit